MSTTLLLCLVIGVADGDTLTARCQVDGKPQNIRVRLGQIDAPETSSSQPYGRAARRVLRDLCFKQQAEVRLTGKVTYGRSVGEVRCGGADVSPKLVRAGFAWAYDGFAKDPELYARQASAKAEGLGLWASAAPIPPWEWRKGVR